MKDKKGFVGGVLFIILIIVGVILAFGFYGGQEAQKVGVTCDMPMGKTFCFQWHKNAVGKTAEFFENLGASDK